MHPSFSVIFFTTASGAGYGLLALIGVGAAVDIVPRSSQFGLSTLGFALALVTAGLLSSSLHLGHPERAWRAFSQWRSSWLSREGVAAVLTYLPAGIFAIGWVVLGRTDGWFGAAGLVGTIMSIVTVLCTAMIYASLKSIHQWSNHWVLPNYLALAIMTGALWLNALTHLWGAPKLAISVLSALSIVMASWLKTRYWRFIDTTSSPSTPGTATGLHSRGTVRFFEGPHTEKNYLLKEMGYRVARKHAARLRRVVLGAGFGLPLILTLLAVGAPTWAYGAAAAVATIAAAVSAMLGVLVERWLFFAEARHSVTLYYGATRV